MHISEPTGPPKEIRLLFSTMMKIMNENLKVEYDRESLSTHDVYLTWRNIETDPLRRDSVNRGQDTYREETFQLVLRNIYWTDKKKLLLFLDDVLLRVPETNLLKALGDELRTRLTALGFNNQNIDQMQIFARKWREQSSEYPETTTLHHLTHQTINIIGGNYFESHNATIINDSLVVNSFNKVKTKIDEETSRTLFKAAEIIEKSGNKSAGALFDKFNTELIKPQPEKSKLSNLWNKTVEVPPVGSDCNSSHFKNHWIILAAFNLVQLFTSCKRYCYRRKFGG